MPIALSDAWLPVYNWLQRNYPKPGINKEWLQSCVAALQAQAQADPAQAGPLSGPALFRAVESQLLLSHLSASCLPRTGLPSGDAEVHNVVLFPTSEAKPGGGAAASSGGCLVMILRIDEVGASAFALQNTMQQRREVISGAGRIRRLRDPGVDVGGAAGRGGRNAEGEEEEEYDDDPGRLPSYPRGMLMLEVTDGHTVMRAMEYKRISGLELGETMLGSKMILRNVRVLRNILQLTPECVTLKGHCVEELEAIQGRLFDNGLRRRMGKDELPVEGEEGGEAAEAEEQQDMVVDPPVPPARRAPSRAAQAPAAQPAAVLEGAEAFLNPEDFFDVDDEDLDDDPPRAAARAPSRQATRQATREADDQPPPLKKRLTIPPRLAINAEAAGPSTSRRTRNQPPIEVDDFSMVEPTEEELEEIMRLEATGSGQGSASAKDGPSAKPPSQSKYFGKAKGKGKAVQAQPGDQQDTADDDIDMDAGMNAIGPRRRVASRNEGHGRVPLFMAPTQIDSDTEEDDSQKENKPVKTSGAAPARAPSRGGGAGAKTGADGDREYREVIELSD